MSGSVKLGLIIIVAVLSLGWVLGIIKSLVAFIMPLALLAGIGLVAYGLISRKALGQGRRRYLP
jgi:hypothetical protein